LHAINGFVAAIAFSSEVGTGSREENASKQRKQVAAQDLGPAAQINKKAGVKPAFSQ